MMGLCCGYNLHREIKEDPKKKKTFDYLKMIVKYGRVGLIMS